MTPLLAQQLIDARLQQKGKSYDVLVVLLLGCVRVYSAPFIHKSLADDWLFHLRQQGSALRWVDASC